MDGMFDSLVHDPDRPVGFESRKTYRQKLESGFIDRYLSGGNIIEIGFRGYVDGCVPIVPQAIGVDKDYPEYDGVHLPFGDETQDAIYSSHCFEHIDDARAALLEWQRVLKVGGFMIIVVPHQFLFEKRVGQPSTKNFDHKRFYTPGSLLREIEGAFAPNSYRVRHLADNDAGFNYADGPRDHSYGCYEIELVLEKIRRPTWNIEDGTIRAYAPVEFFTRDLTVDTWSAEIDLSADRGCVIWGPYAVLQPGRYEAEYFFEAGALEQGAFRTEIVLDVGRGANGIASLTLGGLEGEDALRRGSVRMPFANDRQGDYFEFRIFLAGDPCPGALTFKGVRLRHPEA